MATERLSTRYQSRAGPQSTSNLGGSGYGTRTLAGNWVEERRDTRFEDGRPVLGTELEKVWKSTYTHQTEAARTAVPKAFRSQLQLVDIADGRGRCFPGHQPEQDPEHEALIKSAFATTTRSSFGDPKAVLKVADDFVPPVKGGTPNAQAMAMIARVRHKILKRSGATFTGMRRSLRVMDTSGNHSLNAVELKEGLARYGIVLSDPEVSVLVKYFDKSGDGEVSIGEFVRGIRGDMNERRAALVHKAYKLIDKNCDGVVTLADIRGLYDVSRHPDVVSGRLSADDALRRFMEQWDLNRDDIVTVDEFSEYYNDVSAEIDSDQVFEFMMRQVWHISGGEGNCKNTSCRRVLVIHTNGRQTVQEIKDDLKIGPNDIDKMIANLHAQGIHDVARIELKGAL